VVTIAEKDATRRQIVGTAHSTNQDGQEVLRARFTGFPAQVRLAR
jgi:hypothetical protein